MSLFKHACASLAIVLVCLPASAKRKKQDPPPHMQTTKQRCGNDAATAEKADGRNRWALRCNLIDEEEFSAYTKRGSYAVFEEGPMPFDEWEPCRRATFLLTCVANGCFAPDQQVLFEGAYRPIASAFALQVPTVTTLHSGSTLDNLKFQEEPIEAFVSGATEEDMATFFLEGGARLQVTLNHPMVLASGTMVSAADLKVGDQVATVSGAKPVVRVRIAPFSGSVWNIETKSEETLHNIVVAESFLTGSIRHQNEWKENQQRWALRDFLRE